MSGLYKLLHSGFISEDTSDLIQVQEEGISLTQAVLTQTIFQIDTKNYYDKVVTEMYSRVATEPKVFSDFQFREDVLKKAFELFGKENYISWFRAQLQSPAFSYLHERYLKETILFAYNRKSRTMSHSGYGRLLRVGLKSATFNQSQNEVEGVQLNQILTQVDNALTVDLLKNWTSTVEGLQDLVGTMNVIFGRRGYAAS